jgi:hypothetical protein
MARFLRLEHRDLPPAARQMNGRGEAGDAGSHDGDIGALWRG